MKKFVQIDAIGNLEMDMVLFESYYPILFTCLNEKRELFLCVCCQANSKGKKWLLTKTTPQIVIDILENKITLRNAFLQFPEVQYTILADGNNQEIIEKDKNDWDYNSSVCLPDKGEYMEAEEGEFDDEIAYYKSLNSDFNTIIEVEEPIELTVIKRVSDEIYKTIYDESVKIFFEKEKHSYMDYYGTQLSHNGFEKQFTDNDDLSCAYIELQMLEKDVPIVA